MSSKIPDFPFKFCHVRVFTLYKITYNLAFELIQIFSSQSPESEFLKLTDAAPYLEALYINEHDNKRIYFINLCTELCTKLSQLRFLRWDESEKVSFIFLFSNAKADDYVVNVSHLQTNTYANKLKIHVNPHMKKIRVWS